MFALKTENTFDWPVKVRVPADGGKHETHKFTASFRVVPAARLKSLGEVDPDRANAAMLREIVVGWSEVTDEQGNAIPFSAEALGQLAAIDYVAIAMARAYGEAMGVVVDDATVRRYAEKN